MGKRYRIDVMIFFGMLFLWMFACLAGERYVGISGISIPFFMFGWLGLTVWWFDRVPGPKNSRGH